MTNSQKRELYQKIMQDVAVNLKKQLNCRTVNENYLSKEDVAAEAYESILEQEGYEYLDGLVGQISEIFEYDNLGVFEEDVHEAITNAVCSLTSKYNIIK